MFGIDGEALSKIIGGAATAFTIGLLTWLGNRLNRKDAAERPQQPAAMGIMLDGDTAQQMVRELKDMHADMVRWRAEDRDQEKDDKIERLEGMLAKIGQGQGKTHGNQADIADRVESTDRKIEMLMEALTQPDVAGALRNLRMH